MIALRRIVLALAVLAPLAAGATLERLSLERLTLSSTAIVSGRSTGSRVVRQGPLLYTVYSFEVEQTIKGEPGRRVSVSLPGGELDGMGQQFGGVPELETGREYLLFLWRGPSGRVQITGLSQGLFEIVRPDGGPARVIRRPDADVVIAPAPGPSAAAGAETPAELPLADVLAGVRAALAAGRTAGP